MSEGGLLQYVIIAATKKIHTNCVDKTVKAGSNDAGKIFNTDVLVIVPDSSEYFTRT